MTGHSRPAKNALWYLASNVMAAGSSFATVLLLARYLVPESYGVLAVFITFSVLGSVVIGLSIEGSIAVAFFKRSAGEFCLHVSSCLALVTALFAGAACVAVAAGEWVQEVWGLSAYWLMVALLVGYTQVIHNVRLVVWMVKGQSQRYALFQITHSLLLVALTFVLLSVADLGWHSRALASLAANAAWAAAAVVSLRAEGVMSTAVSAAEMRKGLNFGLPLVPHAIGALLLGHLDRLLVTAALGQAATGMYHFAAQIGAVVAVVTDALNKVFSPWLYKSLALAQPAQKQRIVRVTYLYFVLALVGAGVVFMLPMNVAALVGGARYSAAGDLIPYFVLGQCVGGMYFMVVNYVYYAEKTLSLSVGTLVAGLLGLGLTYILLPHYGALGGAFGFVGAKTVHFIWTWILASKYVSMPWLNPVRFFSRANL